MVEELTRKLNQEHAELSKEELLLIPALNRLKQLFIKAVLENRVTFKSLLPNVQEYIDMIPDEEDKKSFAIQVEIIQAPMMGIFDIKQTGFDENIIGISRDEFAEIIRKSGERIADPNYIKPEDLSLLFYIGKSIEYDEVVINKLLDYKRYDIIKAYKNPINISDETCERIVKEFPFKEYGCPIIVTDYLKRQKRVDLLSFESLSEKSQRLPSRFFSASPEDDIFDIILTKIKQSSLEELEENYKYIDITNYDNEKQEELIKAIMKKGYVIPISDSISQNDNIRKEYFKNIYSCLKNKIEIDPNIITEHIDKIIKENEKLYKEIISSKYAIYLPKEIWEKVQFDEINFENEKIEFGEANIEKLFELPDHIFYKIINTARPQQADNFDFRKLDLQNENVKNKVIALLNSKIRTNRIQLPFGFSPKEQREIVETIMNNQYLKSLDMLQMGRNEILLEHEDLAIKYIRENPAELSDIIRSNINRIMNNEKILDEIVSNEIGIGFLLKELEHVTEIHYTHKLYEKVKNFLTSEYDVELAKLDKLESLVGPLIIKYVKNENIKAVLKLSDEEIEKIIALFPEVIYTVDDAKAAYESIIQYSYATSMPQSHNVFASILHASEEGDLAKINELKCNIMWLMTKEEFIKIGTGESVKEYLDRLLRKENIREI